MIREDSFKRGKNNIEMLLLNILCDQDYYGYELTMLVNKYSNQMMSLPVGSLYPILYKLQEKGYVSSQKKLVGIRKERIYYHIEPAGKEYLQALISDYNYINKAIQNVLNHNYIKVEDSNRE